MFFWVWDICLKRLCIYCSQQKVIVCSLILIFVYLYISHVFVFLFLFYYQYCTQIFLSFSSLFIFSTSLSPRLLRHKYSPQHPIFKHPKPTFVPQCERPSFTPIQNNRQNYSSVTPNLCIFGQQAGRQKNSVSNNFCVFLQSTYASSNKLTSSEQNYYSLMQFPNYLKYSTFSKEIFSVFLL